LRIRAATDTFPPVQPNIVKTRLIAVLASTLAFLAGCSQPATEKAKAEILAADKGFAERSGKVGVKAAFMGVVTPDTKLLSDGALGPDAVRSAFATLPDTATLTWEPSFVEVASSCDFGYTWGRYTLTVPLPKYGPKPFIRQGTYVTIWRRDASGKWKVALDGGTPDGPK